jgi:hypothetical protein
MMVAPWGRHSIDRLNAILGKIGWQVLALLSGFSFN